MAFEVSAKDKAAMRRQAAALTEIETDEEDFALEAETVAAENARRAKVGRPPLKAWWSGKTESEFHERARARGLLRPVR